MPTFKQRLVETLNRLMTSGKVYTVLVGLLAIKMAKHGIILDPDMIKEIVALFMALLVGQGAADFGVRKAQIEAANPKPPEQVNIQNVEAPAPESERKTGKLGK